MRLALLGIDDVVLQLAGALAADPSPRHELVRVYGHCDAAGQAAALGIEQRPEEAWEELLHEPHCDGVILGTGGAEGLLPEQLRHLVGSAMPLIVVHPIAPMLLGFELQMIRQDTGGVVLPYFPGSDHPMWDIVKSWVTSGAESPIGLIEQFEWERSLSDRTRPNVEAAFARDAFLQRSMMGPIHRLGAMLSGRVPANKTDDWSHLSAHMDNDAGVLARWTMRPSAAGVSHLRIVGSTGSATATLGVDPATWSLSLNRPETSAVELPSLLPASSIVDQLQAAVDGDTAIVDLAFEDACRAVELADTLEASCRRGKTINLHQEELTEEGTFKSIMAAGGCLAITVTFLMTLLMVATSPFGPSSGARTDGLPVGSGNGTHWMWKLLLAGLLFFLALQFLRLLFPKATTTESSTAAQADEST